MKKVGKMHEVEVEIILLSKLKHPGIIELLEVLRWPEYVGLVMELGEFGDLFSLVNWVHSKVELQQKIHKIMRVYLAQALEVIDYLHSQGVVHRDIKVTMHAYSALKLCDQQRPQAKTHRFRDSPHHAHFSPLRIQFVTPLEPSRIWTCGIS